MAVGLGAVLSVVLLFSSGALGFEILPGDHLTHQKITEKAILNATAQACRALAQTEGIDFTFPVRIQLL